MTNGALPIAIIGFLGLLLFVVGTLYAYRSRPAKYQPPTDRMHLGIENPARLDAWDPMPENYDKAESTDKPEKA